MSNIRFHAVETASNREVASVNPPQAKVSEFFGCKVFNRNAMAQYLSKETLREITSAIDNGESVSLQLAAHIAPSMRMWAMEHGATHYSHWFHPLTDGTAEKHDAFVEHDGRGGMIEDFSGKLLAQQEPDASSFPNGGLRSTFEARGYSAWDPSSPAFIMGDTLYIPTIFISYTGETLDYKAPLLKALDAVDKAAVGVCKYFNSDVTHVQSSLGWEQEYFLIDEELFNARPDIVLTGRTLMGHESAKNQQLEDHYFGAIPRRVLAFMQELEYEAWKLGIPVKTRHNEVAPNQFELAPIYEECNLACDHNLLIMMLMREVSRRHKFRVLLHEKPFKGINGSGKHNNWSVCTNTGINLFSPGKNSMENLRFVTFVVNALMALYKNNGMIKASIASATNAHRLGANEAPPAIISSFLGKQVSDILDAFEKSSVDGAIKVDSKKQIKLGVGQIPEILVDNTDRNRTSPFAFTGNRFEFRAVGSTANCASAMTAVSAAFAYQLKEFKTEVDKLISGGKSKKEALYTVIKKYIKESKPVRFDGNGYSDEWKKEAAKRGLDCETNVPLIYDNYTSPLSVKVFANGNIHSKKELETRNEVKWEIYVKKIQIEARVLGDLAHNHIIPVAIRYQSSLLDNVAKLKAVFSDAKFKVLSKEQTNLIEAINEHITAVTETTEKMVECRKAANRIEDPRSRAIAYHDTVLPNFDAIRYHIDKLELLVDNEMWPLPKYRELLFVR